MACSFNPNIYGGFSFLPLTWAASKSGPAVVRLLLQSGADPNGYETEADGTKSMFVNGLHRLARSGEINERSLIIAK